MALDPNDGGMKSRKLIFAALVCVVIVGSWVLTGVWPPLAATYGEMLGGLLASQSIFSGLNVATKWVIGKSDKASFAGEGPVGNGPAPAAPAKKLPAASPKKTEEPADQEESA